MNLLVAILTVSLLAIVLAIISGPLRAARGPGRRDSSARAELEAAREAKYREIRDMELDFRTGKLSQEDYKASDGALRSEAIEILDRLQALEHKEGATAREYGPEGDEPPVG